MRRNLKKFLTDEEYYSDKEFLSNSMLQDFIHCKYKYQRKHIDQNFPFIDQDYFIIGRALDTLVTEGRAAFEAKFEVVPRRTKNSEKDQLTKSMFSQVMGMANELMRQPLIQEVLSQPNKCQEVIALKIDGIKRKGKMDFFDREYAVIIDLKSTADIKNLDARMYAPQLAYYKQLVRAKYGIEAECRIAAVDKCKGKWRFEYYVLDIELLNEAEARINRYLEIFRNTKDFTPPASRSECYDCPFYDICDKAVQTIPTPVFKI